VTKTGVQGGILQMLAHGVNVVGLFYITQILRRYKGTNEITAFGGIRITAPVFAGFYMVIMFGSIALPLTNGFPGEFMLLNALYQTYPWMSLVAASGVILGAVYMLVSYQKVMSGEIPDGDGGVPALNNIDKLVFIPVILMILAAGLFPQWIMNISDGSVDKIINLYQTEVNTFLNK
jgi:NADH-quinone oxidoreductase subunit M